MRLCSEQSHRAFAGRQGSIASQQPDRSRRRRPRRLDVAGFLQRAGFSVTVYEQAPTFSRIGAGIILSANVTKVLRRLGLERHCRRRHPAGRVREPRLGYRRDAARAHARCRQRGPLRRALHQHSSRRPACACSRPRSRPARSPSTIASRASIAGAATSARLRQRRARRGRHRHRRRRHNVEGARDRARPRAAAFHRARRSSCHLPDRARCAVPPCADCTKWWGPDRHMLAYFMTRRRDEVYLMGSVPAAALGQRGALAAGHARGLRRSVRAIFIRTSAASIEAAVDVTVMPICDRERNDCWSDGRIVLLGDACHPVRPYMAAGGAMAIEDAAVLSRCLANRDRRSGRSVPLLRGHPHPAGGRDPAHLAREQLAAWADRDRLVLLL